MDETDASFANRCLPLLIANQWGWFVLNDRRIELIWNGGSRIPDLRIHCGRKSRDEQIDSQNLLALSHFGHGILTFRIPYLFQTPPGWNLYVRGPANWCKDGICPLDGIVEADWSSATFTMNWKVTRPETWIAFEEGEPICRIFPVLRGSLESFEPEISTLSQNPELEHKYKEWARSRSDFNAALRKGEAGELWQKHYVRGTSVDGECFPNHQTKLTLREFRRESVGAGIVFAQDSPQQLPAPSALTSSTVAPVASENTPAVVVPSEAPAKALGQTVTLSVARGPLSFEDLLASRTAPSVDFEIVVSSENSPYMAWQTQLFCFSAMTRLKKHPTVVVHRSAKSLLPEFKTVETWGCSLVEAPHYLIHPKGRYPPRNELGSLLTIAEHPGFREGHVLFCEPDMLFVKPLEYSGELAGEYYAYLDYNQERIRTVARKFGIEDKLEALNRTSQIGVPYLIPALLLPRLAQRWIEVLDSFDELDWVDIMYAFGLALQIEDMPIKTTHLMDHNYDPLKPLAGNLIHYCYRDKRWDKKAFQGGRSPLRGPLPSTRGLTGTVLGEILRQVGQAATCVQHPRLFRTARRLANVLRWHRSTHA